MTEQLLNCPVCGSRFLMSQEPHDNHPVAGKFYIYHEHGPLGSEARKCRLSVNGHFDSVEDAISFWNRRAASPTEQQSKSDWVLVPREPTEAMLVALHRDILIECDPLLREASILNEVEVYRSVIAASPTPPAAPQGEVAEPICWLLEKIINGSVMSTDITFIPSVRDNCASRLSDFQGWNSPERICSQVALKG